MTVRSEPGEPPVFFIHLMKTGGTTLFSYISEHFERDEIYPLGKLDLRFDGVRLDVRHHLRVSYLTSLSEERRRHLRVYTGHFPLVVTEILGGGFVTMTMLRDPLERTVSLLRQFRRRAPWVEDPSRRPRLASGTLEEVYEDPTIFEPLVHNHQTKIFSMQRSDEPESFMDVLDVDEDRLAIAKENLATIDVLGVTERYGDFLGAIEQRFGWHVTKQPRANETPATDNEPISDSLRRRILADNALDVDLHRFASQLVADRCGPAPR